MIKVSPFHLFHHMITEIDESNPSALVTDILIPFLIIAIIALVEIQNVFANKNKLKNAVAGKEINNIPFEEHDVVIDGIIPFAKHLDNYEVMAVVGKKNFQVKRRRPEMIPLGVYVEVVDRIGKFKLAVFLFKER